MRRMHSQHTSRAYNGQFTKHQHHVRTKSCTGAHVKNNTSHTFTLASFSWLGQGGWAQARGPSALLRKANISYVLLLVF
jgi:hypothetical protein